MRADPLGTAVPPKVAPRAVCEDYIWTGQVPTCAKLVCPPVNLPGGVVELVAKPGQTIFFNNEQDSRAKLSCTEGFVLVYFDENQQDHAFKGKFTVAGSSYAVDNMRCREVRRQSLYAVDNMSMYVGR